jgi:phage-related protein
MSREANEFLQSIDTKTSNKIKANIHRASVSLDPELFKKLTGDIWEFRTLYAGLHYRMLAFWDKRDGNNTLVITTHGFVKKRGKAPQKEIERAKIMRERYFNYN